MKVYYHGRGVKHRIFIQPGIDHPETNDWMEAPDKEGKRKPKTFDVLFDNHVADVDDKLGKYLVDNGYASKTKFILPAA